MVQGFNKHVEECRRCATEPFNLCEIGSVLLKATMVETTKPSTQKNDVDSLFTAVFGSKP
jgi:Zn-dependent alcohol dehydrogenase